MMQNHGKRNLIILGLGAIAIATLSTGVSLWAYRSSGDIYLDRSRPGYLPDEAEADTNTTTNNNYTFSDTGELTKEELTEYLKELKSVNDRIKALSDPYAPGPLSDESLGISAPNTEDQDAAKKQ